MGDGPQTIQVAVATSDAALAREIINQGYKALCRISDPDFGRDEEAQRHLNNFVAEFRSQLKGEHLGS